MKLNKKIIITSLLLSTSLSYSTYYGNIKQIKGNYIFSSDSNPVEEDLTTLVSGWYDYLESEGNCFSTTEKSNFGKPSPNGGKASFLNLDEWQNYGDIFCYNVNNKILPDANDLNSVAGHLSIGTGGVEEFQLASKRSLIGLRSVDSAELALTSSDVYLKDLTSLDDFEINSFGDIGLYDVVIDNLSTTNVNSNISLYIKYANNIDIKNSNTYNLNTNSEGLIDFFNASNIIIEDSLYFSPSANKFNLINSNIKNHLVVGYSSGGNTIEEVFVDNTDTKSIDFYSGNNIVISNTTTSSGSIIFHDSNDVSIENSNINGSFYSYNTNNFDISNLNISNVLYLEDVENARVSNTDIHSVSNFYTSGSGLNLNNLEMTNSTTDFKVIVNGYDIVNNININNFVFNQNGISQDTLNTRIKISNINQLKNLSLSNVETKIKSGYVNLENIVKLDNVSINTSSGDYLFNLNFSNVGYDNTIFNIYNDHPTEIIKLTFDTDSISDINNFSESSGVLIKLANNNGSLNPVIQLGGSSTFCNNYGVENFIIDSNDNIFDKSLICL